MSTKTNLSNLYVDVNVYGEITEEVIEKKSYKGQTGFWTKWGGRRYSLADNQYGEVEDIWYCASCTQSQPKELSPYKFEYPEGEYIRVCAQCFANACRSLYKRLQKNEL